MLKVLTGANWQVSLVEAEAAPTMLEQEKVAAEQLREAVLETPMVNAAFDAFPEAELISFNLDQQWSG